MFANQSNHIRKTCAVLSAVIAGVALTGWIFDIEVLRTALGPLVGMNPITAVLMILCGASLYSTESARRFSAWLGIAVMICGILDLLSFSVYDFQIDLLLFRESVLALNTRMAPNTAYAFTMIGLSLGLLWQPHRSKYVHGCVGTVTALSALALIGYLYGTVPLIRVGPFVPMALNTSICFLLLAVGIHFSWTKSGFMRLFASKTEAGHHARVILPAVFLAPIAIGWLRIRGEQAGLYDSSFGAALMVIVTILILGITSYWAFQRIMARETVITELNDRLSGLVNELSASNRDLESFSYSVSHDLRAPLRSIIGFSQAILDDTLPEEKRADYLGRIATSARRLATLVDGLLDLSQVSRQPVVRQQVDVSQIANDVVRDLSRFENRRHVHFTVESGLSAHADIRLLPIVMDNLIRNSWKFTAKNENAEIEVGKVEAAAVPTFFVRDNGAGFDMRHSGKLFGTFERLHTVHEFPGTGIGLATVAKIVKLHGGKIWAEGAVGKGAVFYFTFNEGGL